ncbi:hypothetical protein TeGR_g10611, partial [Tetraparma gracilis]
HISHSLPFTPYASSFVPSSARLVCAGISPKAKGILSVHELSSGSLTSLGEFVLPHGIKCTTFGASSIEDRHVAFADYGGQLSVSSLERPEDPLYNVQAHASIVNCIDGVGGQNVGYGAPEIATGGRDGCVRVWDPRTP